VPVVPKIKVENLKPLQKEIRKMKDTGLTKEVKAVNVKTATIVVDDSKIPKRSGALAKSAKAVNSAAYAAIRAGSAAKVPYAGPIHFGWRARGIEPNKFFHEAMKRKWPEVMTTYEEGIREVVRLLESK